MKVKKTDNSKYYNNVVIKVMNGESFGNWNKLIEYVLSLPRKEAEKDYPELIKALDRYNEIQAVWNKIQLDKTNKTVIKSNEK